MHQYMLQEKEVLGGLTSVVTGRENVKIHYICSGEERVKLPLIFTGVKFIINISLARNQRG